jgi:serine protease AprX
MALRKVLLEIRKPRSILEKELFAFAKREIKMPGITIDTKFVATKVKPDKKLKKELADKDEEVIIIRATIQEGQEEELRRIPKIINIWSDAPIEPFFSDCDSNVAKGNLSSVASFVGADLLWTEGFRGDGIIIGIVDGGVTLRKVIGGWPSNWGTLAEWGGHGNMTATDALGMAPEARIYDIRISAGDTQALISNAIMGYRWAIDQYRINKTPQILSNSWGIFQKSWAPDYAINPDHPFTRLVEEAIDVGILVCFSAGNCGEDCPDVRCGDDVGPGKSIWGANGHHDVITVGAVNIHDEWIGYSSQGPAALAPNKPDICAASHFKGYMADADSGTSASCPILAGAIALLKQAYPNIAPSEAKTVILASARDILSRGWDRKSGYGVLNIFNAFNLYKNQLNEYEEQISAYAMLLDIL